MATPPTDAPARHDVGLDAVDTWWRAANYLSVGQVFLQDDPLLRRPLEADDIKPRLLGHWGTCPGLNLLWAHLNRLVLGTGQQVLFVCGPGHGGPAALANVWLEGPPPGRSTRAASWATPWPTPPGPPSTTPTCWWPA